MIVEHFIFRENRCDQITYDFHLGTHLTLWLRSFILTVFILMQSAVCEIVC